MIKKTKDYVELDCEYNFGISLPEKLHPDMLPDTYLLNNPIEFQEVYYSTDKNGYRNTYSYRPTASLTFNAEHFTAPLMGKFHKHDYFEIIINASDRFEMQIESQLYILHKWDVCFLNRSTGHVESFSPDSRIFYLAISPDFLRDTPKEKNLILRFPKEIEVFFEKGLSDTFLHNKNYLSFRFINPVPLSPIQSILSNIQHEFEDKLPGYHLIIRGYLYRFFGLLADSEYYKTEYIDLNPDKSFSLALSAKQLIDQTAKKMSKSEIASALNYNSEYINHVFKKHYGFTIPEYTRSVCLKRAADLLCSTEENVHEICKKLGFTNRSHFYELFKQEFDCTPFEYRKKYHYKKII